LAQHLASLAVLQITQSNNIRALLTRISLLLQGSIKRTPRIWVFLYWKRFALFRNLRRPFEGVCFHGACVLPEIKTHGHGQNAFTRARFDSELYIVYCACKYTVLNPCSYVYLGPRAQCVCAVLFNVLHDSLFDLGSRASPPKGNNTALRMALIFGT
jgi:hypothetical protein